MKAASCLGDSYLLTLLLGAVFWFCPPTRLTILQYYRPTGCIPVCHRLPSLQPSAASEWLQGSAGSCPPLNSLLSLWSLGDLHRLWQNTDGGNPRSHWTRWTAGALHPLLWSRQCRRPARKCVKWKVVPVPNGGKVWVVTFSLTFIANQCYGSIDIWTNYPIN